MTLDARPFDHETLGRMINAVRRSGANHADWAISGVDTFDGVWGHLEIDDANTLSRVVTELVALALGIDIDLEICTQGEPTPRWVVNVRAGSLRTPDGAPPPPSG